MSDLLVAQAIGELVRAVEILTKAVEYGPRTHKVYYGETRPVSNHAGRKENCDLCGSEKDKEKP